MPKPKRPRKPYRPRGVRLDAVSHAIQGAATADCHPYAMIVKVRMHDALASISQDTGTTQHTQILLGVCSITQAINDTHVGNAEITRAADAALDQIMTLHQKTNRVTATPAQIACLQNLLELYEAQLAATPTSKFESALRLAEARVKTAQH